MGTARLYAVGKKGVMGLAVPSRVPFLGSLLEPLDSKRCMGGFPT